MFLLVLFSLLALDSFPFLSLSTGLGHRDDSDFRIDARDKDGPTGGTGSCLDIFVKPEVVVVGEGEELGHVVGRCARTLGEEEVGCLPEKL